MTATKDARLNLRLNGDDDLLVRAAAKSLGETVSQFMTNSAVERAHNVLADQRQFELADEQWDDFVALLDAPAAPDPKLIDLFSRPSRIEG